MHRTQRSRASSVGQQRAHLSSEMPLSYHNFFSLRQLPWDVIHALLWVCGVLVHVHTVLDAVALGCHVAQQGTVLSPGQCNSSRLTHVAHAGRQQALPWAAATQQYLQQQRLLLQQLQGAAMDNLPIGKHPQAPSSPQQAPPYPCNASMIARLAALPSHWHQIRAAAEQHPAMHQLLLTPHFLTVLLLALLHPLATLVLLLTSVAWTRRAGQISISGIPWRHAAAARRMARWRTWSTAASTVLLPVLVLLEVLPGQLDPALVPLTINYNHSSAAGNSFWLMTQVLHSPW